MDLSAKFDRDCPNLRASTLLRQIYVCLCRRFGTVNLRLVSGCRLTPFYLGNLTAFVNGALFAAGLCVLPGVIFTILPSLFVFI
ncbi:hypothetical protein CAMSH0001_1219 [Campylobacter showae RM3277]|uniref:Uncharacterized protein n=1 Tax=Campylobacter showae RM3277 TaxID=553219 RepID=C6RDR2_9BACT|nr:hypothetical protein CAMSH0001_1219 [Campylobacter showae RM3277]